MVDHNAQYIFSDLERTVFIKSNYILVPMELILHGLFIGPSIVDHNMDGVWVSVFFALFFGFLHFQNLRFRKFCLAKWSFDGTAFHVYVKGEKRTLEITQPFCVSTTMLSFNRRYSSQKYPFIMLFKPGMSAPYEEMNGYSALKNRDALIIPLDEQTLSLFRDTLNISNIPMWPRARVHNGVVKI